MSYQGREERARSARARTDDAEIRFENEIARSVSGTVEYDGRFDPGASGAPRFMFMETDTVSALMAAPPEKRVAVVDFASFTHPGGGFLTGSMAQEEALCHDSFLYNVLSRFEADYIRNRRETDRGLYRDRALLCPDIVFEGEDGTRKADVIVCAAPNLSAASEKGVRRSENTKALASRLGLIRDIASAGGAEVLITGAFGCGVFGQDAAEVAELSRRAFSDAAVEEVILAVPSNPRRNSDAFRREFGKG